jgi:hypothetical protein
MAEYSFGQLGEWAAKLQRLANDVLVNSASAVKRSITDGSAITASPGQPVSTGALRRSWQMEPDGPHAWLISTNISYAPIVESNIRAAFDPSGVTPERSPGQRFIKSTVGGHHSVKLTVAGFPRLVAAEVAKLAGA